MIPLKRKYGLTWLAVLATGVAVFSAQAAPIVFWSTQATPAKEQQAVRENVLKNAPVEVEFLSNGEGPYLTHFL